jgi:hypothetical protein
MKSASYFVKIYDTSFNSPKFLGSSLVLGIEVSQVIGLWAMFKANMKIHYPGGMIERKELEVLLPVWCNTKLDAQKIIDAWVMYKLLIPDRDSDLLKVWEWELYEGADLRKSIKRSERNRKYYDKTKDKTSEIDSKTSETGLNSEIRRLMSQTEVEVEEEVDIEVEEDIFGGTDVVNINKPFDKDNRSAINYKIAEVCGWDKPTESQWGRIHKAGKELENAGYGPDEITLIAQNILKTYGAKALTPQGIANNVQLVHGARTMEPKDIDNLQDQKEFEDWANDV